MLVLSDSATVRAAGLSLVFPGGGLLYIAWPLLFVVSLAALALAVVLWWGISAHWAIPLVWLTAGITAVLLADGPRLFVDRRHDVAVGDPRRLRPRRCRGDGGRVPDRAQVPAQAGPRPRAERLPGQRRAAGHGSRRRRSRRTSTPSCSRWTYDMALQPLDEFNGFDWGEQIHGPTCARYQLNMLGYGLALYAANYLPNAPQPVETALANLIDKATDLRVWGYWRTLNLIGNFDANPDPIVRDNIMLSAYLAEQINLYEAATGSTRFDEPGSLTFVWKDGRTFPYDHHSIVEAVRRNFEANALGFFPCEPGWVFTACNTQGAQALKGHDTHARHRRTGRQWNPAGATPSRSR